MTSMQVSVYDLDNFLYYNGWPIVVSVTNAGLTGNLADFQTLQQLSTLTSLDMHGNSLSGSIPASWSNLFSGAVPGSLALFDLGHNMITGTVPDWLNMLMADPDSELLLSYNQLTGASMLCFHLSALYHPTA